MTFDPVHIVSTFNMSKPSQSLFLIARPTVSNPNGFLSLCFYPSLVLDASGSWYCIVLKPAVWLIMMSTLSDCYVTSRVIGPAVMWASFLIALCVHCLSILTMQWAFWLVL